MESNLILGTNGGTLSLYQTLRWKIVHQRLTKSHKSKVNAKKTTKGTKLYWLHVSIHLVSISIKK